MAKIEKLWFDANRIYLLTDAGETLSRPLDAFPVLMAKYIGINKSLLAKYIYGIKKTSSKRMQETQVTFDDGVTLNYVSERLSVTNEQSLMLSLVISDFANQHIDVTDFGRYLRCTPITLLPFLKEMDVRHSRTTWMH